LAGIAGAPETLYSPTAPAVTAAKPIFLSVICTLLFARCSLLTRTAANVTVAAGRAWSQRGVPMSDCLHCDIHEMLEVHPQAEHADLAETAAKVTEVLADLILMAPPDE
jgi:hypothetical protein